MMTQNPKTSRADRMHILSEIAARSPALVEQLLRTYEPEQIAILARTAFDQARGTVATELAEVVTSALAKTVGLEPADLEIPLELNPADSDSWDQVLAQI